MTALNTAPPDASPDRDAIELFPREWRELCRWTCRQNPYLSGITVYSHGGLMVCDRYRLAMIDRFPDWRCAARWARENVAASFLAADLKAGIAGLHKADRAALQSETRAGFAVRQGSGLPDVFRSFPAMVQSVSILPTRAVPPVSKKATPTLDLNPEYVRDAFSLIATMGAGTMTIEAHGPDVPLMATAAIASRGLHVCTVVMPQRKAVAS